MRRTTWVAGLLAVGLSTMTWSGAAAASPEDDGARPGGPPVLSGRSNGPATVDRLGSNAVAVAARLGLTPAELRKKMADDSTLWLDSTGRAYYVEPPQPSVPAPAQAAGGPAAASPFGDSQTFLLHSRPGANRVVYLDFDGHNATVMNEVCGGGCGGVAYVGGFGEAIAQPAFVFANALGGGEKSYAEAATHEIGHTLGLDHDGTASSEYYAGHGSWAPIMGVGYSRPVVQFSIGEYTGANRNEDDLAIMAATGAPLRADDYGNNTATAFVVPAGPAATINGVISTRTDIDMFRLDLACSGSVAVDAQPGPKGPNLDIRLRLLDAR